MSAIHGLLLDVSANDLGERANKRRLAVQAYHIETERTHRQDSYVSKIHHYEERAYQSSGADTASYRGRKCRDVNGFESQLLNGNTIFEPNETSCANVLRVRIETDVRTKE